MTESIRNLALLVWTPSPDSATGAAQLAVPLIHALAARALDAEVEIHFAGQAVRWLGEGAAQVRPNPDDATTLEDHFRQCESSGVRLLACSMAVANWLPEGIAMRAGCRQAGATAFVSRVLAPDWRQISY